MSIMDRYGQDESGPRRSQADPHSSSQSQSENEPEQIEYPPVLIVEDNAGDILLIRESLKRHGLRVQLRVATTGEYAIRLIDEIDNNPDTPSPRLVILDLNLPRKTGIEVLRRLRQSSRGADIPVVILTTSDVATDREAALQSGANKYLQKPSNLQDFMAIGGVIKSMLTARPS
jgi:CheY-like chemotaxis protein